MRRALSVVLVAVGVVVAGYGVSRAITAHPPKAAEYAESAPGTFVVTLPKGAWTIYEQTGSTGAMATLGVNVYGPGRQAVPTSVASEDLSTLKRDGLSYTTYQNVPIPASGLYRFDVTLPPHVTSALLVAPSTTPHAFPWLGIVVDGLVAVLAGMILLALQRREEGHDSGGGQGPPPPTGLPSEPGRTLISAS